MAQKNTNNLIIGGIVAGLCFLVYHWRSRQLPPARPVVAEEAGGGREKAQAQLILVPEPPKPKAQEQDKKRILLAAKEKLGMQAMPIAQNAQGEFELPVDVEIRYLWCQAGDYDAIKGFVRDFDKKIFLLDLESTTSRSELAKPLRLSLGELVKGVKYTFRVNMSAKTNENVTLSLCTDKDKRGHCSEHKPADFARLDALQSKAPDKPLKDDYVYVFHNLFIKNGELVRLGTLDYSQGYARKAHSMLKKEKFNLTAFDRNWKAMKTVRSEGLDFGKGRVTLYLTRNDPKCDMR